MNAIRSRIADTWHLFRRKAFYIRSQAQQQDATESGGEMKKVLGPFDLIMWGIGCIIGAGVFVLTGVAARKYAGPGVVLSYAISALASFVAALCYTEYAVELPVAGGAFNFISMTFGEFAAWVVACDLILEYTLSAAAVAKGCTAYTAALIGIPITSMRLQYGILTFDVPALLMVMLLSAILARSSADSALFNNIVSGINVLLIAFVLVMGFPYVDSANYEPFAPFGVRGIFTGASVVFFSFIGFDTVATTAEEVKNPARDLPIGIVGSLSFCTVLYVLMCLVITGMQNYTLIDFDAPFAVAFQHVGLGWATRVVAAGALTGIITSLLGSLMGQARIYVTLGRQHLVTPWLARIHPRTQTPVNATIVTCCTAGLLALLLDLEVLAELVSIGTLFVFMGVCSGVLFRRYYVPFTGQATGPVLYRLLAVVGTSVAFSLSFIEEAPIAVPIVMFGLWFLAALSFYTIPVRYTPAKFKVPLSPILPAFGMFATLHLIGSLGWPAYVRWVVWFSLGSCVYLAYGMHHSLQADLHGTASGVDYALASPGVVTAGDIELHTTSGSAANINNNGGGAGDGRVSDNGGGNGGDGAGQVTSRAWSSTDKPAGAGGGGDGRAGGGESDRLSLIGGDATRSGGGRGGRPESSASIT